MSNYKNEFTWYYYREGMLHTSLCILLNFVIVGLNITNKKAKSKKQKKIK